MKFNKSIVGILGAAFTVCVLGGASANGAQPTDYLLRDSQEVYLSPGGDGPYDAEGRQFRLVYVNLPPTVRALETVKGRILWRTIGGNPNAVIYSTVIGNWKPATPLATLVSGGYQGVAGTEFERSFEFTAPKTPGKYRIRWLLNQAFAPITNFYSKEHVNSYDPGHAFWTEVELTVE